jgi:hypothetical protein
MAAILVVVCFAEAMVPIFLTHPFPWVSIVPALIPVLTVVFVIRPLLQAGARRPGPVQPARLSAAGWVGFIDRPGARP